MKNSLKTTKITFIMMIVIGLLLVGLAVYVGIMPKTGRKPSPTVSPTPSPSVTPSGEPLQQGDTTADAVILSVNPEDKTIRVYLPESDEYRDLSYTGGTDIRTAFGNIVSALVLTPASVASVSYDDNDGRLYRLTLLDDYWTIEGAANWELTLSQSMIKIGENHYRISKDVATISSEGGFDIKELAATDVINIIGKNGRVYAVELVAGHGTLYVMNEKKFVGGSLFVNNVFAGQITEGMAVSIREGTYEISFSKGDLNGKEKITMNRYGTVVINLEPYETVSTEYGYVDFRLTPEGASLFVDDYYYDTAEPVRLAYGTHKVEAVKQGYVTWSGQITVGTASMKLPIELVEQFAPTPTPTDSPEPTDEPGFTPTTGPTPTPTIPPAPTDAATPTPFPEGEVEVTVAWHPSATIYIDGVVAGTTDNDGNLKVTVKYGDHVIGLSRTTQGGQTAPKNYQITIYPDAPTYLSFPTGE